MIIKEDVAVLQVGGNGIIVVCKIEFALLLGLLLMMWVGSKQFHCVDECQSEREMF